MADSQTFLKRDENVGAGGGEGEPCESQAEALALTLANSIRTEPRLSRLSGPALPEVDGVRALTRGLVELIYPGYFGFRPSDARSEVGHGLDEPTLTASVRAQVERVSGLLCRQIGLAAGVEQEGWGRDVCQRLMAELPAIRHDLSLDVQAAVDGDPASHSAAEAILCMPGVTAITVHRIAHFLFRAGVPLIPRMMAETAKSRTGIDIHPGARIGRSFFIDHGEGVVIGETTSIGEHCKLYQGVTLGARSLRSDEWGRITREPKRHPTLEDHVTVYAGATILGGDTVIGGNCTIGGGVFITESVPPGRTVFNPKPEMQTRANRERPPANFQI